MSNQPELVVCERCQDDLACGMLIDGRAVCRGCVFAVCNELLREQPKPAVGPATKQIMDMLGLAVGGRDERLSVTIDCGGYEEYLGIDVINAALAELEAKP
jgi:hypothetical protein